VENNFVSFGLNQHTLNTTNIKLNYLL
jgi:hypothetical protein